MSTGAGREEKQVCGSIRDVCYSELHNMSCYFCVRASIICATFSCVPNSPDDNDNNSKKQSPSESATILQTIYESAGMLVVRILDITQTYILRCDKEHLTSDIVSALL